MKTRIAVVVLAVGLVWFLVAYLNVRETQRSYLVPVNVSEASELLERVNALEARLDRHETHEREYVSYVNERFVDVEDGLVLLEVRLFGTVNWLDDLTSAVCASDVVVFEEAHRCDAP